MSVVSLRTVPSDTAKPSRADVRGSKRYAGIFDGYNGVGSYSAAFDEMFDAEGNVRGPYKGIFAELAPSDASELAARSEALGRAFVDQGITFSLSGQERPFPLDLVPRVISAAASSCRMMVAHAAATPAPPLRSSRTASAAWISNRACARN